MGSGSDLGFGIRDWGLGFEIRDRGCDGDSRSRDKGFAMLSPRMSVARLSARGLRWWRSPARWVSRSGCWRFGLSDAAAAAEAERTIRTEFAVMGAATEQAAGFAATRAQLPSPDDTSQQAIRRLFDVASSARGDAPARDALAVTVYDAAGSPLAWSGRASDPSGRPHPRGPVCLRGLDATGPEALRGTRRSALGGGRVRRLCGRRTCHCARAAGHGRRPRAIAIRDVHPRRGGDAVTGGRAGAQCVARRLRVLD